MPDAAPADASPLCPVCGYERPGGVSLKWEICPSCGTLFGLTDAGRTYAEIREMWIDRGAQWQSTVTPPPPDFNPAQQLKRLLETME